jgi:hypothetical protein
MIKPWVVLTWHGGKGREHERCATWQEADEIRMGLYSQGPMVTIDAAQAWDRARAQDEIRAGTRPPTPL